MLYYDKDFLLKLDKSKNKTIYARITALTFEELPIETIEGRVTGGSINLDGASAMRRTCSLTLIAKDFNYNYYYWGLNSKFKLEIGVENSVDSAMPDVIWFNQGIYLITQFNTSQSTNNFTITINGKDKICLLNGEVSGALESSVDFGVIEEENDDGIWSIRKIPIKDIIRNMIHIYAKEPYHNIIINDLDIMGLELLEYRQDTPLYFWRNIEDPIYKNFIFENDQTKIYYYNKEEILEGPVKLSELTIPYLDILTEELISIEALQPVYINPHITNNDIKEEDKFPVYLTKITYGQTAGYRITDLVYPKDLIANVGETITSVLDKIKNMLTEFEYFYNTDGQFVFQKKQSSATTLWSPDKDVNQNNSVSLVESSNIVYNFLNGEFITAFNNNPNLLNARNDYSIWGERITSSGTQVPIHLRYAIDIKPTKYTTISMDYGTYEFIKIDNENDDIVFKKGADFEIINEYNKKYNTTLEGQNSITYTSIEDDKNTDATIFCDWREIIYQMALDYYKYGKFDNFIEKLIKANPELINGKTGYENYYTDLQGFWRQLYFDVKKEKDNLNNQINNINKIIPILLKKKEKLEEDISTKDKDILSIIIKGNSIQEKLEELQALQREYYEIKNMILQQENKLNKFTEELKNLINNEDYYIEGNNKYWNRNVFENPSMLNFWFDFLDTEGELQQFNVKNIGSRSKSINDTSIKSIYFREIPSVIFYSSSDEIPNNQEGYKYIQIPKDKMETMFSISAQGKSAKDRLDELIYQHGYCIETATITSIPIYYLEPNSRIYIHDESTGLNGEYIASKITLPLTYNGTMSITATKAVENQ